MIRIKRDFRRLRAKSKEALNRLLHRALPNSGQDPVSSDRISTSPPVAVTTSAATTAVAAPTIAASPSANPVALKINLSITVPIESTDLANYRSRIPLSVDTPRWAVNPDMTEFDFSSEVIAGMEDNDLLSNVAKVGIVPQPPVLFKISDNNQGQDICSSSQPQNQGQRSVYRNEQLTTVVPKEEEKEKGLARKRNRAISSSSDSDTSGDIFNQPKFPIAQNDDFEYGATDDDDNSDIGEDVGGRFMHVSNAPKPPGKNVTNTYEVFQPQNQSSIHRGEHTPKSSPVKIMLNTASQKSSKNDDGSDVGEDVCERSKHVSRALNPIKNDATNIGKGKDLRSILQPQKTQNIHSNEHAPKSSPVKIMVSNDWYEAPKQDENTEVGEDMCGHFMNVSSAPKLVGNIAPNIDKGNDVCSFPTRPHPPKLYRDPEYVKSLQRDQERWALVDAEYPTASNKYQRRRGQDQAATEDDDVGEDVCGRFMYLSSDPKRFDNSARKKVKVEDVSQVSEQQHQSTVCKSENAPASSPVKMVEEIVAEAATEDESCFDMGEDVKPVGSSALNTVEVEIISGNIQPQDQAIVCKSEHAPTSSPVKMMVSNDWYEVPKQDQSTKVCEDVSGRFMNVSSAPKLVGNSAPNTDKGNDVCSFPTRPHPPKLYRDPELVKSLQRDQERWAQVDAEYPTASNKYQRRRGQDQAATEDDDMGEDVCGRFMYLSSDPKRFGNSQGQDFRYHNGFPNQSLRTSQKDVESTDKLSVSTQDDMDTESVDQPDCCPMNVPTITDASSNSEFRRAENYHPSFMEVSELSCADLASECSKAVPHPANNVLTLSSTAKSVRCRPYWGHSHNPEVQSEKTKFDSTSKELSSSSNGMTSLHGDLLQSNGSNSQFSFRTPEYDAQLNNCKLLSSHGQKFESDGSRAVATAPGNEQRSSTPVKLNQDERYSQKVKNWSARFPTPSKYVRKAAASRETVEQMDCGMGELDNVILTGFRSVRIE